ncbi:hypothetical protein LJR258_002124 [Rhizobium sp. LjRoot258]
MRFLNSDFSIPGASFPMISKVVGGFLGTNYQMDSIVVGIEGDLSYNWKEGPDGPWHAD